MNQIVEPKIYQGKELETNFFTPMLRGTGAERLGVRVLYNMPVPTVLNFLRGNGNALRSYAQGWSGDGSAEMLSKTIDLYKVKSETGYSAADYYTRVLETISSRPDIDMGDLSGTELEEAETRIFRESLAESLRATMWIGDTTRGGDMYDTFDGILALLERDRTQSMTIEYNEITDAEYTAADSGEAILRKLWNSAPVELRELKSEGQLAFFVTSDIYSKYEDSLDAANHEAAYIARQEGRTTLSFRGIPVVDMQVSGYLGELNGADELPKTWAVLADRRNIVLAVNTGDFPGTEVRMWYNADEMQNRQRAVFAVGCNFLLPDLICYSYKQ
ncbi:MAG: hypothetical protein LBV38_04000 [Alistipes sp.]|jgi:hypothetical protein|nr:hypothetical protein [Alistipes sp.]